MKLNSFLRSRTRFVSNFVQLLSIVMIFQKGSKKGSHHARFRPRPRFGVERINHKATAPPTMKTGSRVIY